MELSKFKSIPDLLKAFPTEQHCLDYLTEIRWNGNVISPFDATSRVYKCKLNRYKCKNTNKYFNAKTGTIFEDTKIPLQKWFIANYLFSSHKKGISSYQLGRDIDVSQKTAWFMLHRLRVAFGVTPTLLGGIDKEVEIDECYIGGRGENKHKSKRKFDHSGRMLNNRTTQVFGMIERGGSVITKVVEQRKDLKWDVYAFIRDKSTVYSDEAPYYKSLKYHYPHDKVNHARQEYVRGKAHTNSIEGYWSHLKRGINGIYHHISIKHLQAYLDEYSLRFNTRKSTTSHRFDVVLKNMVHRLKYHDLISNEKKAA